MPHSSGGASLPASWRALVRVRKVFAGEGLKAGPIGDGLDLSTGQTPDRSASTERRDDLPRGGERFHDSASNTFFVKLSSTQKTRLEAPARLFTIIVWTKRPTMIPNSAARMLRLRQALASSQVEFCARYGFKVAQWSNFENGRSVGKQAALRLVRLIPGLTLDWIYLGEASGLTIEMARLLGELPPRRASV